jgi:hypothetical protein
MRPDAADVGAKFRKVNCCREYQLVRRSPARNLPSLLAAMIKVALSAFSSARRETCVLLYQKYQGL